MVGTPPTAPVALTIDRIEPLSEKYFDAARKIQTEFIGTTNKRACLICPCAWFPPSRAEFEGVFRKSEDRCSTYGLAIREDDVVVGVINLRQGGQEASWDEKLLHNPSGPEEVYIDYLAVSKDARGMGAGTRLLQWAEEKAKERGATKIMLGVVNGNPAKRLYDRTGYKETHGDDAFWTNCVVFCCFGMPHGQCGGIQMEKDLAE